MGDGGGEDRVGGKDDGWLIFNNLEDAKMVQRQRFPLLALRLSRYGVP